MRLCMFHPAGHPMERGWVGRVDGDRVVHLAAQTLQSFFTGGGSVREHAEYPLAEVVLLAPVLHPPSIRVFEDDGSFAFANPAAVVGPGAEIGPSNTVLQGGLAVRRRIAAVIGAGGLIGGLTILAEWRAPALRPPKDRDFALGLGPVVVTTDECPVDPLGFDWTAALALAGSGTVLYPGDLLAGPALEQRDGIAAGETVALEIPGLGTLEQRVAER
jgi:hypothetical protein